VKCKGIETKENCYSCKHRGTVPGSCHSSCHHPASTKVSSDNPMLELMSIFASVGRSEPVCVNPKELNIKANEHGIKSGWFNFPFNFDPVWLENCDGHEKISNNKEEEENHG